MDHGAIDERFGHRYVRVQHPAGLQFEVVEATDVRRPWTTGAIGQDVATRGFFGTVLSVRDVVDASQFFVDALGFEPVGQDGAYHRLQLPSGGPASVIDLLHEPERPAGSWHFGEGTFHHVAFHAEDDAVLASQKARIEELGYTDASEVKDRFYFHSMQCARRAASSSSARRTCAAVSTSDERPETLGQSLSLPPWYEDQRATILSQLEQVRLPAPSAPARFAALPDRTYAEVPLSAGAAQPARRRRVRTPISPSGGRARVLGAGRRRHRTDHPRGCSRPGVLDSPQVRGQNHVRCKESHLRTTKHGEHALRIHTADWGRARRLGRARRAPPPAQVDFSGEWTVVRSMDNTENPWVGDWVGLPLNPTGSPAPRAGTPRC